jgi:hypothetical protein
MKLKLTGSRNRYRSHRRKTAHTAHAPSEKRGGTPLPPWSMKTMELQERGHQDL